MKKFILVLISSILICFTIFSQSSGDYRSIGNGNWNDATKWQRYNGNSWVGSNVYPGQLSGDGTVTIMKETEIRITASVPYPVASLSISIDEPTILTKGVLTFNAPTAVALFVSGYVVIGGELRIDDQPAAKTHELAIGGSLNVLDVYDGNCFCYVTNFQTINQDDKLGVTFNSTGPGSYIISQNGISFHDITFNGGDIQVYTNIVIGGTATFINGIVRPAEKSATNGSDILGVFDISFWDGSAVSGGSNASYIEGAASKSGIEPFTFPMGHEGFYAPFTISGIVQPERFFAMYSRGSSGEAAVTDPELFSVSSCEGWSLIRDSYNPVNPTIDVTVGWTSPTRCGSSSYIANVSDIVLTTGASHGGTGIGTSSNGSVTWVGYNLLDYGGSFTLGNVGTDCRTPLGLNITNITTNSATVSWSLTPGAISYDVEYSTDQNSWISTVTGTTSTSVTLSGLSPSVMYFSRVKANCGSASTSSYKMIQFTTPNDCGLPSGLAATNITSSSATLSWAPAVNAINYSIQYANAQASSWYTVASGINSLSYNFSGLLPSSFYHWRVIAHCPSGALGYVQSSFTTLALSCDDIYEINNTSNQAKTINIGNAIFAGISSATDVDWFKVTTPNNSNTNLEVTLSNLAADYDLYVYNKSLKLVGSSVTTGTSNEVVIYNSTARKATYFIKVSGKNGANSTSQCYTLLAQANSSSRSVTNTSTPQKEINEGLSKQLLYPNPASEFVYMDFNSVTEGLVNIQIVNSIGQLVKQHTVNIIKGQNQIQVQVADIRPGMYILKITKSELNITRKFMIAR